jgi:hypothetical protein
MKPSIVVNGCPSDSMSPLPPPTTKCVITDDGLFCYLPQQAVPTTPVGKKPILVPWITGWEGRRLLGLEAEQLAIARRSKARDEAVQEQQKQDAEDRAQRMANNQRVLEERRKLAASSEKAKSQLQQNGEDEEEGHDGAEIRDLKILSRKGECRERENGNQRPCAQAIASRAPFVSLALCHSLCLRTLCRLAS